MSNRYKTSKEVPTSILAARLKELSTAVTQGPDAVLREFNMRIPAECDHDADLVLSEAAARLLLQPAPTDEQIIPQRVTMPGQVREGDHLLMLVSSSRTPMLVQAEKVLGAGTGNEEVIYDVSQNYYFITRMVGTQWHKAIWVIRAALQGEGKG